MKMEQCLVIFVPFSRHPDWFFSRKWTRGRRFIASPTLEGWKILSSSNTAFWSCSACLSELLFLWFLWNRMLSWWWWWLRCWTTYYLYCWEEKLNVMWSQYVYIHLCTYITKKRMRMCSHFHTKLLTPSPPSTKKQRKRLSCVVCVT